MRWLSWKDTLLLCVVGGIVGAVCDGFHSHQNILEYSSAWAFKMAWWVPLLFAGATLTVAYGHLLIDDLFHLPHTPPGRARVIAGLLAFVAVYAASAYLPVDNDAKILILDMAIIAMWLAFNRSWQGVLQMILTSILGCAVEISLVANGSFRYLHAGFLGIPYWLPFLYGAASIGVGNWARQLAYR